MSCSHYTFLTPGLWDTTNRGTILQACTAFALFLNHDIVPSLMA